LLIGARGVAAFTCDNQKFFGPFFQKRTACFLPLGEARIWVNHKGGWYNDDNLSPDQFMDEACREHLMRDTRG
jgi:hypothetical protein